MARQYEVHYKFDIVTAENANEAIKKGMKLDKEFSTLVEGDVVEQSE